MVMMTHGPHSHNIRGTRVERFGIKVFGHIGLEEDVFLGLEFVIHLLRCHHPAGDGVLDGNRREMKEG